MFRPFKCFVYLNVLFIQTFRCFVNSNVLSIFNLKYNIYLYLISMVTIQVRWRYVSYYFQKIRKLFSSLKSLSYKATKENTRKSYSCCNKAVHHLEYCTHLNNQQLSFGNQCTIQCTIQQYIQYSLAPPLNTPYNTVTSSAESCKSHIPLIWSSPL